MHRKYFCKTFSHSCTHSFELFFSKQNIVFALIYATTTKKHHRAISIVWILWTISSNVTSFLAFHYFELSIPLLTYMHCQCENISSHIDKCNVMCLFHFDSFQLSNSPFPMLCRHKEPKWNCIFIQEFSSWIRSQCWIMQNWKKKTHTHIPTTKLFIRCTHHLLFEFILPAQNITRMATFLMFHIFYCSMVVCFCYCCCSCCYCCAQYFERLPFSWAIFTHSPSLSYFTHFTCSVYVDTYTFYAVNGISRQHGQRKQNYNDATRPSTVHSHIYTYSCRDARLYSYILHNFTLCTSSETSFARAFSISFAASPSLSLYVIHTVRPKIFAIIYN